MLNLRHIFCMRERETQSRDHSKASMDRETCELYVGDGHLESAGPSLPPSLSPPHTHGLVLIKWKFLYHGRKGCSGAAASVVVSGRQF